MFVIGEVTVDERIAREHFACDVAQCKGACCTLPGGRGAPLEDDELKELERAFPAAKKFLSEHHLQIILQQGLHEGEPGSYATTCVEQKACAFVYYQDGVAKCSFEKAFLDGETSWRKPRSCHLFPVRISQHLRDVMRYEEIPECNPALANGREKHIPVYVFLKDALVRKYGETWYDQFYKECQRQNAEHFVVE